MLDNVIEKGISYLYRKLKGQVHYYESADLNAKLAHFAIKRLAILVDGETKMETLTQFANVQIVGYFSFGLNLVGTKINGFEVKPLILGAPAIDTDGWLVSSLNALTGYSLNQYLLEKNKEGQVILQHLKQPNGTTYYSYIDFFSNDVRTIVQLHNYFDHCYRIPFPLDVRYTLRDDKGQVIKAGQVIIPTNGIKVISSDDFQVSNFKGYLEVEFDVTSKVMSFLQYDATYVSDDFIMDNHQSGLGLYAANTCFSRGYVPVDQDESLVVCLFQRHYADPVTAKAILEYTDSNGKRPKAEKMFPPVGKNQIIFQDVKELFSDVDFAKIKAPVIITQSEVPLHRPNYYYSKKGKKGFYDVSHAGPDTKQIAKNLGGAALSDDERQKVEKNGCYPMDLSMFLLPCATGIESVVGLGNEMTVDVKDFRLDFYDQKGDLKHSFEETLDFHQKTYFNMTEYLRGKGIKDFSGIVALRPGNKVEAIPVCFTGIAGFRHKDNPYMTTTAGSGAIADNIPFYFRGAPPNYIGQDCSTGITDIFGLGISSPIFDTYYAIMFSSADKSLKKEIEYELQVMNEVGKKAIIYRKIAANGSDYVKLSELVEGTGLATGKGYYAVWIFASGVRLNGLRLLVRKRDNAISIEHCYAGKYGL